MLRHLARIVVVAVLAAGCVAFPGPGRQATYEELRQQEGWVLLDAVPVVKQDSLQDCGAASLSMVFEHWGVDVSADTLMQECAVEGEEGLRAVALRDAARRRGFSAYLFAGRVADLEHELRRGRPVVVGVIKSAGPLSVAHFEVVVGLHPREERVAALDPARGLVCNSLPEFAAEWAATDGVTLVVFRPEPKAVSPAAVLDQEVEHAVSRNDAGRGPRGGSPVRGGTD
jgi:ABC-type bacteriocin/lantibiotic exporter with double-glycine peptidase domain